jgi:hypothetical protein
MLYGSTLVQLVIFCEENPISALRNLSIHMSVSFFVANSGVCDYMFSHFLCMHYYYQNYIQMFFINKLICISCMLYAAFHVEWSPLRVCSLSKKGINNNYYFLVIFWALMIIIIHTTNYMRKMLDK